MILLLSFIVSCWALDPDTFLKTDELIRSRGYICSNFTVSTADDYQLGIFRVSKSGIQASKGPVLLQHGMLDTSATWVINSRTQSLAYILVDQGFDVWLGIWFFSFYSFVVVLSCLPFLSLLFFHFLFFSLFVFFFLCFCFLSLYLFYIFFGVCSLAFGFFSPFPLILFLSFFLSKTLLRSLGNSRGNSYSYKNRVNPPTTIDFWKFDWDQHALIDIPETIDFILYKTNSKTLKYVGHSQGATIGFFFFCFFFYFFLTFSFFQLLLQQRGNNRFFFLSFFFYCISCSSPFFILTKVSISGFAALSRGMLSQVSTFVALAPVTYLQFQTSPLLSKFLFVFCPLVPLFFLFHLFLFFSIRFLSSFFF